MMTLDSGERPQDPDGVKPSGDLPSDQRPIAETISKAEAIDAPTRYIAGFWRRLFAFVVDTTLISIPGFLLGYFFYGFFSSDSGWGPIIGFAITIPYFAVLGSSIGNGQTIGQRWTGIEVVDGEGNYLSFGRSFVRYAVLLVPLFFGSVLPRPLTWLTSSLGIAIVYLYLFNTRTRQTLHDLVTGSIVVETPGIGTIERSRVWPGHWAILGILAVAGMLAPSLLYRTGPFSEMLEIQKTIEDSGEFQVVNILDQVNSNKATGLRVIVKCRNKPADYEQAAARIVAMVEQADPQAVARDYISVDFKEGFQIGLATFSNSRRVSHSPRQWEQILQKRPD